MARKKGSSYIDDRSKSKRKVTSYEDEPIEDYVENKRDNVKYFGTIIRMGIILFISFLLVFVAINWDKFSPDNIIDWFKYDVFNYGGGNGYPVTVEGTGIEISNIKTIDDRVVYVSDTSIIVLNDKGGTIQNTQHSYSKPSIKTNGNKGIIYNLGGNEYMTISKSEVLSSDTFNNNIISADIARNGTYAIISETDGYLSKLTALLNDNTEMYKYSFSEYYINELSLSSDGQKACVSGISAKNGIICSIIYIIDFSNSLPIASYEFNDSIIYDLCYLENGNIAFVADTSAGVIDVETSNIKEYDYNDRDLTAYQFNRDEGLVVSISTSSDGRNCSIVSISKDCNFSKKIETKEKIQSLELKNNNIFLLSYDGVVNIYNLNGDIKNTFDIKENSNKVICLSNKEIYALSLNQIYQYNL